MITEIKKIKAAGSYLFKVYKTENGKREWIEVYSTLEEAQKHVSNLTAKPTAKPTAAASTAKANSKEAKRKNYSFIFQWIHKRIQGR